MLSNMFIINKEYSLIGKIRSFKLRVLSSNLNALDLYLYNLNAQTRNNKIIYKDSLT